MGYCMNLEESTASFKVRNAGKILKAIKNLHGNETIGDSSGQHFSWVSNNFYEINDIEKMFMEWRWAIEKKDNKYVITEFLGEKYGNEDVLFKAIAQYMNDGHIIMRGEDGAVWKWKFQKGRFSEYSGKVVFADEFHISVNDD